MREKLLKQALESGKTKSNKLKSKNLLAPSSGVPSRNGSVATSPNGSKANSRSASRAPSRQPSEEGEDSDGSSEDTGVSNNSADAFTVDELQPADDLWPITLETHIKTILARTRRINADYSTSLRWYISILRAHYTAETLSPYVSQLTKTLLRTATSEATPEAEVVLALKAFSLTAVTAPESEDYFEVAANPLKTMILTHTNENVKAEAVHTLALVTLLSGTDSDTADLLAYFLDAISSDGTTLEAADSATVVTAAIESYALLTTTLPLPLTTFHNGIATYNHDPPNTLTAETSHEAIETLSSQLPSPSAPVLIAAAETLALLYSLSCRPLSDENEPPTAVETDPETGIPHTHGLIQTYVPYRRTDLLLADLKRISKSSSKSSSKTDRRALHATFTDVLHSITHPGAGPRYSESKGWKPSARDRRCTIDEGGKTGYASGNRERVKMEGGGVMVVDTWVKWHRVRALRRVLCGHGLAVHGVSNEAVGGLLMGDKNGDGEDE